MVDFEAFKESVKAATDIVTLIDEYVPLKPAGKDMVGRCPFHDRAPVLDLKFELRQRGRCPRGRLIEGSRSDRDERRRRSAGRRV